MKDYNAIDLDINYDFRTDSGGKDPDMASPTLRRYHRLLWSKPLPNGEVMELTHDNGGYLKWKNFEFGSDAMLNGLFFRMAKNSVPELKKLLRDYDEYVEAFEHQTWTIGGEIIFPRHDKSMNQLRGTNPYIKDRWDLTLECIRRFYVGESSPLYDVLNRDRAFYELFVDFKGYVDFFFLQDCVTPDYSSVIFWQDDNSLSKALPLPRTAGEHIVWVEKNLEFVKKRAERMKKALACDEAYRDISVCFVAGDNEYHYLEHKDTYYEVLDEVVDLLKRDKSLDVSTKGLRATPYSNGYARYLRINNYCCAILFDKQNWEDSQSVQTPFWLGINNSEWKLTNEIKTWFDQQDTYQVARKWNKRPCLALVPLVDTPFHQVCEDLAEQIADAISNYDTGKGEEN